MFDMLVQRGNPVTPITPMSTPPDAHPADLSPRSSNSSFGSSSDGHQNGSMLSPNNGRSHAELSALQKLQFALQSDGLFSAMLDDKDNGRRLVKPCQGSSSSSVPNSPDNEEVPSSPSSQELKTHTPSTSPSIGNANNIFQCPLCCVVCNSRHEFNEHLVTHTQQHACPKCSFFTDDEEKLKEHIVEAHDINDLDLTDDEVRTPKTNSQGKVKTFKCKQCGWITVTKMEFWEHTKSHIRHEKMLTCPKCPFVTEYKHHLEYHLRNHFGSKPFQCTKCAYSCVNKSMLNSHLKSHSNIYQYRCADCAYATKYCHSLKLHLRKYDHKPSMVLNPDGTPNPLPIIDVYGTRRGPKVKRTDPECTNADMGSTTLSPVTPKEKQKRAPRRQNKQDSGPVETIKTVTPPASPQFPNGNLRQELSPPLRRNNGNGIASEKRDNSISEERNVHDLNRHSFQQFPQGFPLGSINPLLLQHLLMQNPANGNAVPTHSIAAWQNMMLQNPLRMQGADHMGKGTIENFVATMNQYALMNGQHQMMNMSLPLELVKLAQEQQAAAARAASGFGSQQKAPTELPKPSPVQNASDALNALDLRNPKRSSETVLNLPQDDGKKRKRKGIAQRYERIRDDLSFNHSSSDVLDFSNNNYTTENNNVKTTLPSSPSPPEMEKVEDGDNSVCKFCDIAFPPVLYALHMRFHSGDGDPFRCNVCGTKSSDKVSFFVHLATASH